MKTLTTAAAALALAMPALAQVDNMPDEVTPDVTLIVSESAEHGEYLALARARSDSGRPVYIFSTDTRQTAEQEAEISCLSDKCLRDWTPVVGGINAVGEGVDLEKVGAIAFRDQQVALYNGWPLYHYEMDQVPMTETPRGHGEVSFGGEWLLLSPEGEPIPE